MAILPHRESARHSEFESELEFDRARITRRRFLWMVGVTSAFSVLGLAIMLANWSESGIQQQSNRLRFGFSLVTMMTYLAAIVVVIVKRRNARFTSGLALALITVQAAVYMPIERIAASLEGTFSMAEIAAEAQKKVEGPLGGGPSTRTVAIRPGFVIELGDDRRGGAARTEVEDGQVGEVGEVGVNGSTGVAANPATSASRDRSAPRSATRSATRSSTAGGGQRSGPMDMGEAVLGAALTTVGNPAGRTAIFGLWQIFFLHFVACLFMPWTFRESMVPGLAGGIGYGLVVGLDAIMGELGGGTALSAWAGMGLALVPGGTLCWWRHSRYRANFQLRFESGRYRELKSELASARKIHESCLPAPLLTGPTRVAYLYRPMRDIGGDLLMCRRMGEGENAPVLVAVIDVTGHGIVAAITVNRLLGELDRIVGESPDIRPARVMSALNRYVTLMLGSQGLYLSAAVFLLDPVTRTLAYASGGHPAAYLLRNRKTCQDLESTCTLLGVLSAEDYDASERTVALEQGDIVIACTDGALETRLENGTLLMTAGLRSLVDEVGAVSTISASAMPEALHRRLDGCRSGGAGELEDDTLVIALWLA